MDKTNKLTLSATIIIASLILGGFVFATQVIKQRSIERQQEIEIEQEKQDQIDEEIKEQQAKEEAEQALDDCIATANFNASNSYLMIEDFAKTEASKQYNLSGAFDDVKQNLEQEKAECFLRYPLK